MAILKIFKRCESEIMTVAQDLRLNQFGNGGQKSHVVGEAKQSAGIGRGDLGEVGEREAADLGQPRGRQGDSGRLVGLAAAGMRAEIGAVGLDQKPVERNAGGHVAQMRRGFCS